MKAVLQIAVVFSLCSFFYSCQGQPRDEPVKKLSQQPAQVDTIPDDFDPYFSESQDIIRSEGPKNITRNILQDKEGHFWFATWEGIIHYNPAEPPFKEVGFTNLTNKEGLRRYRVFSLLEDRHGDIWFGTIGAGLYHYDGETFTNITTKEGLVNNSVTCIFEDKAGNLWFGTQEGVSKYDGNLFTNYTTNEGLSNNDINSIIEDKDGKFWFGTRGNACTFDGKKFNTITTDENRAFGNVRSIIEDREGHIWLGGNDGLWRYDGQTFANFSTNFTGYIMEDRAGHIWTSSAKTGNQWVLTKYDKASLDDRIKTATQIKEELGMLFGIIEDNDGHIWVGSLAGVYRYNGDTIEDFR